MKKKTLLFLLFALPIVLSSYAQTEVNKDFIASTPLEKAVKDFAVYVTDKYINDTYIKKISLEHQTWPSYNLKIGIDYIKTSDHFYLEGMDGVMLYHTEKSGYSRVQLFSKSRITDYWGNYTKEFKYWSEISDMYADTFFVLLGNIVEAYKEQTMKGYKTTQNYQQRLEFLKKADHVIIEKKSVVKLVNASKEEKFYKALKKRTGDNFEVWDNLYLNPDLKTYHGELNDRNGLGKLLSVEVEFISPPPGLTAEELKKQQEEKGIDTLFAAFNKEHFQTITKLSKTSLETDNKNFSKNGFAFVDESIVMAYTELTMKKAYGQSYKLDPHSTYVFVVTGLGLNKVSVLCGGKSLNIPALNDDPYEASVTKPLKIEDGVNHYILTISTARDYNQGLLIEVFGEFVQYACIHRYKKK